MKSHQIDLHLGESIRVGVHTVTVLRISEEPEEVVLELEGPDGLVEWRTVEASVDHGEEPALV